MLLLETWNGPPFLGRMIRIFPESPLTACSDYTKINNKYDETDTYTTMKKIRVIITSPTTVKLVPVGRVHSDLLSPSICRKKSYNYFPSCWQQNIQFKVC
jgi:hypothetical protein